MDFKKLQDYLDTIPGFGAPGVDCIVKLGYETVFRHCSGMADREQQTPMTGKEAFFLYSATKPITCAAALQLVEQGKLRLEDPVSKYLPEYASLTVRHTEPDGSIMLKSARQTMTVLQLMTMTTGLDYDLFCPEIRQIQAQTGGKAPTLAVIRALSQHPLSFEPGQHWQYGLSHDVLAAVIEAAGGQRFGEYLWEHIFMPLGMKDTGFCVTEELRPRMMAQYKSNRTTGEVFRIPLECEFMLGTEYESGGAGLISTVDDYILFAEAMANGGVGSNGSRILSAESIDLMRTNHLDAEKMRDYCWVQLTGYGYGLGVRTMIAPELCDTGCPVGEFGWEGAAGCYVLIDPSRRLSLFYAQQMRESMGEIVLPKLRDILYTCL